jgi:adenylate kinase
MNILFLGPQGSGKSTQAKTLADKFGFFYLDSGAFLRDLAKRNETVKKTIDSGKLIPGKEMTGYIEEYLNQKGVCDNIVFDGFPRSVDQYVFFKDWLKEKKVKLDLVLILKISKETAIKRLGARRIDQKTGKIYNLITNPPKDNFDKKRLVQREDDTPKAIKKRLELYHSITMPLIQELKKDTKIYEINAEEEIDTIQQKLVEIVNEKINN